MGRSSSAMEIILSLLVVCAVAARPALAGVAFSSLQRTLVVSASPKEGQVLRAGEDAIDVSWALNQSFPAGTDAAYKEVKIKLCYAPESQTDRAWRKTNNDLSKDKTCQFEVTIQPYSGPGSKNLKYLIEKTVPTATFFVRAYVLDSAGTEVAYGQTTNTGKTKNLFKIQGITGRHASLDIAAACFSAFSVVSLIVFFVAEKKGFKK